MSYLRDYDSVFFSGHGDDDCIGGNNTNGFSDKWMFAGEINSTQVTNEVTLMTCYSYNDFGDALLANGTRCVVGWPGKLASNAFTERDWAWHFYNCTNTNSTYCMNHASYKSGINGSESKGDCSNTHGTVKWG